MAGSWISAEEAQARLGVKLQTLYAYASRGLIANRGDWEDPRRSLYAADDVQRLALRKLRGRRPSPSDEASVGRSEPLLATGLCTLFEGRPYYRSQDAVVLSDTANLEEAARLMWDCGAEDPFNGLAPHPQTGTGPDPRARAFSLLAHSAAHDPATLGRTDGVLQREAAGLLTDLCDAMCGQVRPGPLHDRLAKAWRVDGYKADVIRRALVLCIDHPLDAPAFAARTAASAGATLAASVLAGFATMSGPLESGKTAQVAGFLAEAKRSSSARNAAAQRLAQGLDVPGFGHPLYPYGDPRAEAMRYSEELTEIARAGEAVTGAAPSLDFALVAMSRTLGLPAEAPWTITALARATGWIAHALEQRASGGRIVPKPRYVGVEPGGEVANEDDLEMVAAE